MLKRKFFLGYLQSMYNFSRTLINCYNPTSSNITFSSPLILVPVSLFLLIPSALWHIVQILVDKYIFLQQVQGIQQKPVVEESISQTLLQQTQHKTKVVLKSYIPHPANLFISVLPPLRHPRPSCGLSATLIPAFACPREVRPISFRQRFRTPEQRQSQRQPAIPCLRG